MHNASGTMAVSQPVVPYMQGLTQLQKLTRELVNLKTLCNSQNWPTMGEKLTSWANFGPKKRTKDIPDASERKIYQTCWSNIKLWESQQTQLATLEPVKTVATIRDFVVDRKIAPQLGDTRRTELKEFLSEVIACLRAIHAITCTPEEMHTAREEARRQTNLKTRGGRNR